MLDENTMNFIKETRAKHEFLTFLVLQNDDIRCGVIQNETSKIIMLYDFEKIIDPQAKARFLRYGDEWWWQSNQSVPIDSFIGERFEEFRHILTGYPKKSLSEDIIGPTFSLADQYLKRIKKRRVDIVSRLVPQTA